MLNIVTVNWRNYTGRGIEYTNNLHDMVRRNLEEGYKGRFIVYTDNVSEKYADGIEVRQLPVGMDGWFNKLWLFSQLKDGRNLYLDLDTVIVGALDDIASYKVGFAILRDFYRPQGLQSSVMAWVGDHSYIYDEWEKAGFPQVDGGDQAWLEKVLHDYHFWQDEFAGDFVSYKANGCESGFPKGTKVVVFHGEPRPHQCGGWVSKVWKIGGGTAAELMVKSNVEIATLIQNRRANLLKGFPEVTVEAAHDRVAVVIAGGPSLAEYVDALPDGDIFAVNGVMRYLNRRGIVPEFFSMIDARPENIEFCHGAALTYLMASQVDPPCLQYLDNVKLWHVALPGSAQMPVQVGGATTVGLLTVVLAYVMGYRTIHMIGFDSCYGESHHAYPQKLNDGERVIDVTVGDSTFKCAPWMAQQGREFCEVAPELVRMGCEIQVHGYGLIPTIAQNMEYPRTAADDRAEEILARLPEGKVEGAEIGVFCGDLSRRLLLRDDLTLHMVDAWEGQGKSYEGDSGDFHAALTQEQQDECERLTKSVTAFAGNRARVVKAYSHDAADRFTDGSLDFVFIDADHGYEGCKRDLNAWYPKVRDGGLFSGHDYENTAFHKFGVTQAVDEFADQKGVNVEFGRNFTWFIKKPSQQEQ